MRFPVRLVVAALGGILLVSGCALRDPRDSYAYGRAGDGLWDAEYDLLLDWNFPTSGNQPPVEAPKRFRPERPAIGVPWATGNPMQPRPERGQAGALEPEAPQAQEPADDAAPAADVSAAPARAPARLDARARGARVGG